MALRGIQYEKLSWIERLVMYQKFTDERMATVTHLAAQVFAPNDGKKAADFLHRYMEAIFPEVELKSTEITDKEMFNELMAFTKKDIVLVQGQSGLELKINEKKE